MKPPADGKEAGERAWGPGWMTAKLSLCARGLIPLPAVFPEMLRSGVLRRVLPEAERNDLLGLQGAVGRRAGARRR